MNTVYLLLGGNLGNVKKSFSQANRMIEKKIGPVKRSSSIYRTAAWGLRNQADFLNLVMIVSTELDAHQTMQHCLQIENDMGRVRSKKNAARIIDIDILFFNHAIIKTDSLHIPHPRIQDRRFTLVPINELSPNFKHPVLQKTIHRLLLLCTDDLLVEKI